MSPSSARKTPPSVHSDGCLLWETTFSRGQYGPQITNYPQSVVGYHTRMPESLYPDIGCPYDLCLDALCKAYEGLMSGIECLTSDERDLASASVTYGLGLQTK